MKTQHTPGPWENVIFDSHGRFSIQCPTGRIEGNDYISSGEMHSNAALIASAPELLGALESLLDWAECQCGLSGNDECYGCCEDEELAGARAAIQKAKGE